MGLLSRIRTVLTMGRGVIRGLTELEAGDDPFRMFGTWYDAAQRSGILLPEAMTVATAARDGTLSARMMLLKGFDERGFIFYTNYQSRKSQILAENPNVALVFHWPILERQVRVEGKVERIAEEESRAYFRTRPRGSQIGAWASSQSSELASRTELERSFREHEERFQGQEIPLPPFWGGYRVRPERIEFWQGRLNRLHDRLAFHREEEGWKVIRLYP